MPARRGCFAKSTPSREEYEQALATKKRANAKIHRENPSLKGYVIHEKHPVKFGGSPTDPTNKIYLEPGDHSRVSVWWRALQRLLTGK